MAQNEQRRTTRLTVPVLAVAGTDSTGSGVAATMRAAADDVRSLVIPDCGHYPAEEAPQAVLDALQDLLGPLHQGDGWRWPPGRRRRSVTIPVEAR